MVGGRLKYLFVVMEEEKEEEEVLVIFLEVDDDDEEASRFRLRDMTKTVYWYTRYSVSLSITAQRSDMWIFGVEVPKGRKILT